MHYVISQKEPGLSFKELEVIDQAMEAYSSKYKPQLPWVTVEKNLYSMIDVNRLIKTQIKGLE